MNELIEKFNPANAENLTDEDILAMQNLDVAAINELAAAYPNNPRGNTYLKLFDKSVAPDKQFFQESTWANLASLVNLGRTNFVAYTFTSLFDKSKGVKLAAKVSSEPPIKVDLGEEDLANAAGFKKPEEVNILTSIAKSPLVNSESYTDEKPVTNGEEEPIKVDLSGEEQKEETDIPPAATTDLIPVTTPVITPVTVTADKVTELERELKELRRKKADPSIIEGVEKQIEDIKKQK